jgi:mono/diheme cytochrome c family protein
MLSRIIVLTLATLVILALLSVIPVALAVSAPISARPLTNTHFERTGARKERGKYLTEGLLQCFVCHSERDWTKPGAPPIPALKGAGLLFHNEPGYILAAPNITPDVQTGAGSWTDDMFARAIREGVGHDGRALHPLMWYDSFVFLTDEDLASVVLYLRSIPAIHHSMPHRVLPAKVEAMISNNPRSLTKEIPPPDASTPAGRGEYLVAVADCIGCHTAWEAPSDPGFFGGGNLIEREKHSAFSANLTQDPSGIPYYTPEFFAEVIRTGSAKARKLSPIMPWIVFKNLNDQDLNAIFACLLDVSPVHHTVTNDEPPTQCVACGQKHGGGERNRKKEVIPVKVDASIYAVYAGEYRYPWGDTVTISTQTGHLFLESGSDKIEILPLSSTKFDAAGLPGAIDFVRDKTGKVLYISEHTPYGKAIKVK